MSPLALLSLSSLEEVNRMLRGGVEDMYKNNLSIMSWVVLTIAITITWTLAGIFHKYMKWYFSPLRNNVPGPKSPFLLGEFPIIRKEAFMVPHFRWIREITGWDVPMIYYSIMFGRPSLLILDKEVVKTIVTAPYGKEPMRFGKDIKFMRALLGEGLLTTQGSDWMRHRQIIQPAFFTQVVKESLNASVPPLTRRLVKSWKRAASQGREIDVTSHLSSLTLDIIGQAAFSHEFKALESVEHWAEGGEGDDADIDLAEIDDPFIQALMQTFKPTLLGTILFTFGMPTLSKYLDPKKRKTRLALNAAVDRVIANARASIETEKNNGSSMKQQRSLLQLLLQASDGESTGKQKTLNDMELRDETKTFIFAGHETTSTWCYMAIYALVANPGIQDKVYQDIVRHAPPNNKILDSEAVDKMEYLNAFLQEVLRLYSPVGMFTRINSTTEHLGGYTVPAGTRLIIAPYLLHRHPKYWSDPERFEPERWLQQKEKNEEFLSQIRFAFMPFSAGGRNCIGQRFATIEAKLIMAELIRSFAFQVAPSQRDAKFTFSNIVVMRTKPRLKIVVKSRD